MLVEERRPWGRRRRRSDWIHDSAHLAWFMAHIAHVPRGAGVDMLPFSMKEFGALDRHEVQESSANTVSNTSISFVHVQACPGLIHYCKSWLISTLRKASISVVRHSYIVSISSTTLSANVGNVHAANEESSSVVRDLMSAIVLSDVPDEDQVARDSFAATMCFVHSAKVCFGSPHTMQT